MTRKTQRILKRLFPYFSVILVGFLIVLGVLLFAKTEETAEPDQKETSVSEETESEETTTEETSPTVAAVDALQVDQLIDSYYVAKINDDAEALNEIVDCETTYNVADLADETQFVTKYDNFKTYTLPGLTEDCFLVYVKYDIFFNGITTGAPALNHFIVVKVEEGKYEILDRDLDDELTAYVQETENSKIVQDLKAQVEEELEAACEENEDLKYLMAMLNNESVTEEAAGETLSEETAGEETSPEEAEDSEDTGSDETFSETAGE